MNNKNFKEKQENYKSYLEAFKAITPENKEEYNYPGEKHNLNYLIANTVYNLLEGYRDYVEIWINEENYIKAISMCEFELREAVEARKDYKKVITFEVDKYTIDGKVMGELKDRKIIIEEVEKDLNKLIPTNEVLTTTQYLLY